MNLSKPRYDYKNKLVVKRISEVPDEKLLRLTQNQRQARFWLLQKQLNALAAKALESLLTGENDPLAELEQMGEIDEYLKNRAWLLARWYHALWALVQQVEPLLRRDPKRLVVAPPFESAFDLFTKLLQYQANLEFSLTLKPYIELSSPKVSAQSAVLAKICQGEKITKKEERLIPKFPKEEVSKDWLAGVVAYAETKVTDKRPALKAAFRDYCNARGDIVEDNAKKSRKCPSIVLEHGMLTKTGTKEGGNYI